jgi:hypothetical protein
VQLSSLSIMLTGLLFFFDFFEKVGAVDVEQAGPQLARLPLQSLLLLLLARQVGLQSSWHGHAAVQLLQLFAERDNHARHGACCPVDRVTKSVRKGVFSFYKNCAVNSVKNQDASLKCFINCVRT